MRNGSWVCHLGALGMGRGCVIWGALVRSINSCAVSGPGQAAGKPAKKASDAVTEQRPPAKRPRKEGDTGGDPPFPGIVKTPPIFVAGCTVYTSVPTKCWRVKASKGSRLDVKFAWGSDPAAKWHAVVQYCHAQDAERATPE
jgi:hypothetical protein